MWTASDVIKALWIFRQTADKEPCVWWNETAVHVFDGPLPHQLSDDNRWALLALHWVYVEDLSLFGEPCWRLLVKGG